MADYYRDLIQLLRQHGFELKRQGRGDHEIWWNPKSGVRLTLRSRFTANGILKEAGLPKAF